MKKVYAREMYCLDCKVCEVACKTAHSKSHSIIAAYKYESPEPVSRIHVEGGLLDSQAVQCRHCAEPKCVAACITGAMQKDPETGVVTVDEQRCIGCLTCVVACPFGCVVPSSVALKCDLCTTDETGDGEPACVKACPNRALLFLNIDTDADSVNAKGAAKEAIAR